LNAVIEKIKKSSTNETNLKTNANLRKRFARGMSATII
jgi:hypothetical protein